MQATAAVAQHVHAFGHAVRLRDDSPARIFIVMTTVMVLEEEVVMTAAAAVTTMNAHCMQHRRSPALRKEWLLHRVFSRHDGVQLRGGDTCR